MIEGAPLKGRAGGSVGGLPPALSSHCICTQSCPTLCTTHTHKHTAQCWCMCCSRCFSLQSARYAYFTASFHQLPEPLHMLSGKSDYFTGREILLDSISLPLFGICMLIASDNCTYSQVPLISVHIFSEDSPVKQSSCREPSTFSSVVSNSESCSLIPLSF